MKKVVVMLVLFLLCSSIFAIAQETNDSSSEAPADCNLGCKIWQFLFGSKEARAGKAWFDRSEPLVGSAVLWECTGSVCTCHSVLVCYDVNGKKYSSGKTAPITDMVQGQYSVPSTPEQQPAPSTTPAASSGGWQCSGQLCECLEAGCVDTKGATYSAGYKNVPIDLVKGGLPQPTPKSTTPAGTSSSQQPTATTAKQPAATPTSNNIPTWTKETDKDFHKEGTVFKNSKGEYFIVNSKGTGVKVTEAQALQKLQENAAASGINPDTKSQLQESLGSSYQQFEKSIGKVKNIFERPGAGTAGTLVMSGSGGEVIVDKKAGEDGILEANRFANGKLVETYLIKNTQILISQEAESGNVKVGDASYKFPKDKNIADSKSDLSQGIQLPGEKGESSGFMQLKDGVMTAVDYDKETMQIIKTQESQSLKIDYYKDGESGCSTKGGCWVPTGGTATISDADGKPQSYLIDYDYKTPTGADREFTGANRKLEDKELFNPLTGRQEGTILPDGSGIAAQRGEKGYTGLFEVTDKDGNKGLITKDEKGNWAAAELEGQPKGEEPLGVDVANKFLANEKNKKLADDRYSSTQGSLAQAQGALQSIYAVTNSIKSYPAISNLIFGKATFYKDWRSGMDKAFAPLLGSNWIPSAICENDELHWKDIEPEGKAVIKTISGTYQAVASIQMERSQEATPILCHKNPDEEADQQFICDRRQVCVKDQFCYADEDRDGAPDSKNPLKGYFYKITWAASAPRDEAFTPLKDENGVAVSFNIFLKKGEQATPIYNLNGNVASPIQLQNGASDRDVIIKYSTNLYDQACIVWNQAPISMNVAGREGAAIGFGKIDNVCFSAVTSSIGEVNWQRSGQGSTSVSQKQGGVSKNTDW